MFGIRGLILATAMGVLVSWAPAQAQDAPKPAVQVIIGADGSVKVIDPKTGKEISSVVTRVGSQSLQRNLEEMRKAIEKYAVETEKGERVDVWKSFEKYVAPDGVPFKIELFDLQDDNKPRIILVEKKGFEKKKEAEKKKEPARPQPKSLDEKVDLILKQLDELRRDVNQIKGRLDGKPADSIRIWGSGDMRKGPPWRGFGPPKMDDIPWKALEGKLDAEQIERIKAMIRKVGAEERKEKPANPTAELERHLERLLREAEELRREIQKRKPK